MDTKVSRAMRDSPAPLKALLAHDVANAVFAQHRVHLLEHNFAIASAEPGADGLYATCDSQMLALWEHDKLVRKRVLDGAIEALVYLPELEAWAGVHKHRSLVVFQADLELVGSFQHGAHAILALASVGERQLVATTSDGLVLELAVSLAVSSRSTRPTASFTVRAVSDEPIASWPLRVFADGWHHRLLVVDLTRVYFVDRRTLSASAAGAQLCLSSITAVFFDSHDGTLYTAETAGSVTAWSVISDACVIKTQFEGHFDRVTALLVHQRLLFSASWDGTVRVFDTATGREVSRYEIAYARAFRDSTVADASLAKDARAALDSASAVKLRASPSRMFVLPLPRHHVLRASAAARDGTVALSADRGARLVVICDEYVTVLGLAQNALAFVALDSEIASVDLVRVRGQEHSPNGEAIVLDTTSRVHVIDAEFRQTRAVFACAPLAPLGLGLTCVRYSGRLHKLLLGFGSGHVAALAPALSASAYEPNDVDSIPTDDAVRWFALPPELEHEARLMAARTRDFSAAVLAGARRRGAPSLSPEPELDGDYAAHVSRGASAGESTAAGSVSAALAARAQRLQVVRILVVEGRPERCAECVLLCDEVDRERAQASADFERYGKNVIRRGTVPAVRVDVGAIPARDGTGGGVGGDVDRGAGAGTGAGGGAGSGAGVRVSVRADVRAAVRAAVGADKSAHASAGAAHDTSLGAGASIGARARGDAGAASGANRAAGAGSSTAEVDVAADRRAHRVVTLGELGMRVARARTAIDALANVPRSHSLGEAPVSGAVGPGPQTGAAADGACRESDDEADATHLRVTASLSTGAQLERGMDSLFTSEPVSTATLEEMALRRQLLIDARHSRRIPSASELGATTVYERYWQYRDTTPGTMARRLFPAHETPPLRAMRWSFVVAGYEGGDVGVWCAECGARVEFTHLFPESGLVDLIAVPQAELVLCVASSGALHALPFSDFARGGAMSMRRTPVDRSAIELMLELHASVTAVAQHARTTLVMGGEDGWLRPHRTHMGDGRLFGVEQQLRLRAHAGAVLSVAICAAGRHCVSGGTDQSLCVWDLKHGALAHRVQLGAHVRAVSMFRQTEDLLVAVGKEARILRARAESSCAGLRAARTVPLARNTEATKSTADLEALGETRDWFALAWDSSSDELSTDERALIVESYKAKWARARVRLLTLIRINYGTIARATRAAMFAHPKLRALRARAARRARTGESVDGIAGALADASRLPAVADWMTLRLGGRGAELKSASLDAVLDAFT